MTCAPNEDFTVRMKKPRVWAHSEDSEQTGWMRRLIWVLAGQTYHFVGFVMVWLKLQLAMKIMNTDHADYEQTVW